MAQFAFRLSYDDTDQLHPFAWLSKRFHCEYSALDSVVAAGIRMHFHACLSREIPELYICAL